MSPRWLALNECPHGIRAISLDHEDGGLRLTSVKCCGSWNVIQKWAMSAAKLRDLANEFECAADEIENEEDGGRPQERSSE